VRERARIARADVDMVLAHPSIDWDQVRAAIGLGPLRCRSGGGVTVRELVEHLVKLGYGDDCVAVG
jgi:hypothetical protein